MNEITTNNLQGVFEFSGVVQGRGVRPGIYQIAKRFGIVGFVRNIGSSIEIEVFSEKAKVILFKNELIKFLNTCGEFKIDREEYFKIVDQKKYDSKFQIIKSSEKSNIHLSVTTDLYPCRECISKFNNSKSSFHKFPFIACTKCGPRYSILKKFPYDRENTADITFPRCTICDIKFNDPKSEYYFDMAFSCANCGPYFSYKKLNNKISTSNFIEIVQHVTDSLLSNKLVGIKGTGLYHIIGIANEEVERKIRTLKKRPFKPFAYMFAKISTIKERCIVSDEDIVVLTSQKRPILILPLLKSLDDSRNNGYLGVSLPTNIFYLELLKRIEYIFSRNISSKVKSFPGIIYTSMNLENSPPINKTNVAIEFCEKYNIEEVCDYNREIVRPIEDTVLQANSKSPIIIRPGRGYYPKTFKVPNRLRSPNLKNILALGSQKYCSFALSNGSDIYLSQSYGTQKSWENVKYFIESIKQHLNLYNISPEVVVCDVHPNQYAEDIINELSKSYKFTTVKADHHHAHLSGVIIENNIETPAFGVIYDGVGADKDNNLRGADFLFGDLQKSKRVASFEEFLLPGGDICEKEIYRTALSLTYQYSNLSKLELELFFQLRGIEKKKIEIIVKMLTTKSNTYKISSMGRIFDAIAFLSGISDENSYQAESPIKLMGYFDEKLSKNIAPYSRTIRKNSYSPIGYEVIGVNNLINEVLSDIQNHVAKEIISTKFHLSIVDVTINQILKYFKSTKEFPIIFSGGVFQNSILKNLLIKKLEKHSLEHYWNENTSPGDYSIPLGQIGYILGVNSETFPVHFINSSGSSSASCFASQ